MIKSGNSIFSIPLDEVAEVVRLEDYKESKILHSIEQSLILDHQQELLPLVDLNQILFKKDYYSQFDMMNIVIVRGDGFKYGIIVDEILDIEEIVVKKMSKHLKEAKCFMGITFVGHGALALILDLASIAEKSNIKYGDGEYNNSDNRVSQVDVMEFMQFNLRKSKSYAFPLEVVNRLEEISTNTIEFCGAVPLVRYREKVLPLLFIERQLNLCSLKENLTDLYPEVLKVIVVDFHNKCFGIIVDEILDIGTTSNQIDTRNINREGFMGTVFIADRVVTIIDIQFLIDTYINFEEDVSEKEISSLDIEISCDEAA